MMHKSEVLQCFQEFRIHFENKYDQTIKYVHSDNGGEYTHVANYAEELGILVTRAAPYTPEANGISERINRNPYRDGSYHPGSIWFPAVLLARSYAQCGTDPEFHTQ
jgi:hypothetical protein